MAKGDIILGSDGKICISREYMWSGNIILDDGIRITIDDEGGSGSGSGSGSGKSLAQWMNSTSMDDCSVTTKHVEFITKSVYHDYPRYIEYIVENAEFVEEVSIPSEYHLEKFFPYEGIFTPDKYNQVDTSRNMEIDIFDYESLVNSSRIYNFKVVGFVDITAKKCVPVVEFDMITDRPDNEYCSDDGLSKTHCYITHFKHSLKFLDNGHSGARPIGMNTFGFRSSPRNMIVARSNEASYNKKDKVFDIGSVTMRVNNKDYEVHGIQIPYIRAETVGYHSLHTGEDVWQTMPYGRYVDDNASILSGSFKFEGINITGDS